MLHITEFVSTILLHFFTIQLSRCDTVGDNLIRGKLIEDTNNPSTNNYEWAGKGVNEIPDTDSSQAIQLYNSQQSTMVLKGLEDQQVKPNTPAEENNLVHKINQVSPDVVPSLIRQEKAIDGANQEKIRLLKRLHNVEPEKVQELIDEEKKIHDAKMKKSHVMKKLKNISPEMTLQFATQERILEDAKEEKTRILQKLNKLAPELTRELIRQYDNVIPQSPVSESPFNGYPSSSKEEEKEEYFEALTRLLLEKSDGTTQQGFAPTQPASPIQYDAAAGHITEATAGHKIKPQKITQQVAVNIIQANQKPSLEEASAPPTVEKPPQAYVQPLSSPSPNADKKPLFPAASPAYLQPVQDPAPPNRIFPIPPQMQNPLNQNLPDLETDMFQQQTIAMMSEAQILGEYNHQMPQRDRMSFEGLRRLLKTEIAIDEIKEEITGILQEHNRFDLPMAVMEEIVMLEKALDLTRLRQTRILKGLNQIAPEDVHELLKLSSAVISKRNYENRRFE